MRSPYAQDIVPTSGNLKAGERYTFEVIDGVVLEKCVAYNRNADYPNEVRGKEFGSLTEEQQNIVMKADPPTYGTSGDEAPRFEDKYEFQIKEITTGRKMGYFDREKGYYIGAVELRFPDGKPGKSFYALYKNLTGKTMDAGSPVNLKTFFDIGKRFTAQTIQDGEYVRIIQDSILPEGAAPVPVTMASNVAEALDTENMSENAKRVNECIQANKEKINGQAQSSVLKFLISKEGLGAIMENAQVMNGWREIKDRMLDQSGNLRI